MPPDASRLVDPVPSPPFLASPRPVRQREPRVLPAALLPWGADPAAAALRAGAAGSKRVPTPHAGGTGQRPAVGAVSADGAVGADARDVSRDTAGTVRDHPSGAARSARRCPRSLLPGPAVSPGSSEGYTAPPKPPGSCSD